MLKDVRKVIIERLESETNAKYVEQGNFERYQDVPMIFSSAEGLESYLDWFICNVRHHIKDFDSKYFKLGEMKLEYSDSIKDFENENLKGKQIKLQIPVYFKLLENEGSK